jgi:predicted metal-dependent phosphotriesterase family hydrolase
MAHVQTVLGPIEPAELGFTLPHEHTQIALWHVPDRWDYWQLTRDEPVILEELAAYRDTGGRSLVDLTLPGVGRDPAWLTGIARASGLHVVMGCGWYRGAYYPAEARIDRRSVDALADELVAEATDGVGETGVRPGIIGEIGTDKPWVSAPEERVHRAAARAARRTGLAITTHAVLSPVGVDQLRMSFTPAERHGEGRVVDLLVELLSRGHVERVLLSQDVCHDSQLRRYEGNGYTYLVRSFLPRLRAAGVSEAEIATMTVANPRRLLTVE